MRRWFAWAGTILLAGCTASSTEVLPAIQPGGGPAVVFQKPLEIVFPAAVRVVNIEGEKISEASQERGRIVLGGITPIRAIFFNRLPNARTRVELSPGFFPVFLGGFLAGPDSFFISLREQIVIYEKKEVVEKERRREAEGQENLPQPLEPAGTR